MELELEIGGTKTRGKLRPIFYSRFGGIEAAGNSYRKSLHICVLVLTYLVQKD